MTDIPGGFDMDHKKKKNRQQDEEIVISSGDRLSIENIAEFVQSIRKGLAGASTVVIDFKPNVEMDITALQVLCSACKTASAEGQQFAYRGPLPALLQELVPGLGSMMTNEQREDNTISCFHQFQGAQQCPN